MLSPFRMVCGNFILPEPASYVFFYAFSNLRNLLYIINIDAEFYLSSDPDKSNGLVWQSEDGNTFFCITSTLPQDIMLRLAESVQVKK